VRGACDERSRRAERRMCTTVGASDSPLREMSAATEGIRSLARPSRPPASGMAGDTDIGMALIMSCCPLLRRYQ